jgi:hypothetical protein
MKFINNCLAIQNIMYYVDATQLILLQEFFIGSYYE